MFTGIIKEVGRITLLKRRNALCHLGVLAPSLFSEVELGDSISVNGVCLTLVDKKRNNLFFEVIKPTLDNTNLKRLKQGDFVNLEPSLRMGDSISGHFILGHIDCEGRLIRIIKKTDYLKYQVSLPLKFKRFLVEKGSVGMEGISLTVERIERNYFTVNIIPFTLRNTNLQYKIIGSWVNLEFDYLLKKVSSFPESSP